jgi:hypothetical protein
MKHVQTLGRIHALLTIQTVVILLLSINRLSSVTAGYVAANEFLRWVDFHNMLTLPLISLVTLYYLKETLADEARVRNGLTYQVIGLLFAVGLYLFGAGYGAHEVTNYLHIRFCDQETTSALCRIIIFTDDEFSHWIWFAGFVLINLVLILTQVLFPYRGGWRRRDTWLLIGNGLFVALGIFANLAFEEIGLDLYVVAFLALLAVGAWWRYGRQPLFLYYATGYWVGLIGAGLYKLIIT